MLRLVVWIMLLAGFVGLLGISFSYFEPVKTKKILRLTRNWFKSLQLDKVESKTRVADYRPIVLKGSYTKENLERVKAPYGDLRLLDFNYEGYAPSSIEKVSVYLDGQRRHAIAGTPPFYFSYDIRVPKDAHLWLSINQEEAEPYDGQLDFQVLVASRTHSQSLYNVRLPSNHKGWENASVDLSAFSGQHITLKFSASFAGDSWSKGKPTQKSIKAYWSNLVLRSKTQSLKKPNIFLILIDTLRPDHLSSYGYGRPTSPHIDKLAEEGVRFENAYSAAPWTNPSVLSLFTGLYPSDVWEPAPHKEAIKLAVPSGVDTIAEILSMNGYITVAASDHPGINYRLFGQGFDIYSHLFHVDGPYSQWRETDSEKVLKQLYNLLEGQPKQGLFVYVHLIYPHQPYEPPPPYEDYFGPGALEIKPDNKDYVINMYDGDIRHTDEVIKAFMTYIEKLGLSEDSITVLLSDHGEGFWEHGLWEHGNSLYNELLRIPLVFHAPGRIPENRTIRDLVRNIDVLPTILDLADIKYDRKNYRGVSLLPLMKNGAGSKRLSFGEFPHSRIVWGRSIQSLTEKLIDSGKHSQPPEYYNIAEDPGEQNNLSSGQPSRVSDLLGIMNDISRSAAGSRVTHPAVRQEPSEDTIRKLKSLGYIQ